MREITLSVVMTTYNHERYIAQAIESVLMQQTAFGVEIVVGNDCSSDRTQAIVDDYRARYPEFILTVDHSERVGMRANYRRCVEAAEGRYIAMLDGDDYFTAYDKLQKQVELLEQNPDVGMCYTRSRRIDQDGNTTIYPEGDCLTSFEAMLRRNPAENCTVVARRELVLQYYSEVRPEEHPEWLTDDLPMWLWFAARSRYMALDRPTAVHRVLSHSVSHNPDYRKKLQFVDSLADISLWYDEHYNSSRLRHELLVAKQNTALWILSFNGSAGEYLSRWWSDIRSEKQLIRNIASYGLFIKKIAWRMWRKNDKR